MYQNIVNIKNKLGISTSRALKRLVGCMKIVTMSDDTRVRQVYPEEPVFIPTSLTGQSCHQDTSYFILKCSWCRHTLKRKRKISFIRSIIPKCLSPKNVLYVVSIIYYANNKINNCTLHFWNSKNNIKVFLLIRLLSVLLFQSIYS